MKKMISLVLSIVIIASCFSVLTVNVSAYGNDDLDSAEKKQLNTTYTDYLSHEYDDDWYRFTLPSDGVVNFVFDHEYVDDSALYWAAYLYSDDVQNEYRDYIKGWLYRGTDTKSIRAKSIGLPAGTYYIKIETANDSCFSSSKYYFKLAFTQDPVWEKELNDSYDLADSRQVNKTYYGNLLYEYDDDWYKFTLPYDGVVHFNFAHDYVDNSAYFWSAYLYNEHIDNEYRDYIQSWIYKGTTTSNEKESGIGLPAGTYYIKIETANDSNYTDANYRFKLNFTKDSWWEKEINDDRNCADTRQVNKTYYGNLLNQYDEDWYKFTIPKDGKISFSFTHDYVDNSVYFWSAHIYNVNADYIDGWSYRGTTTKTVKSNNLGLPAGTYYVNIETANESNYTDKNYRFKLNYSATTLWEKEFNDSEDSADKLTLNKYTYGSINYEYDEDYYKITLTKSAKYVMNFVHDYVDTSKSVWKVSLLDSNKSVVDYMNCKGTKTDVIKSKAIYLPKGTYYLKVSKGGTWNCMANYRVMLSEHLAEPKLKKVSNGPNGIDFSWTPISNADGYVICRKEGYGGWKRLAVVSGTSKYSYVDKALKAGVKYTYTVKAYKGDAYSYYSEAGLPIIRLSKAGITGLSSVSNGVKITWHKTTGAAGYMIYRSTGDGVFTKIATVKGYNSVSYIDKTAKKGVKYIYRTKAYNGASVSPTSDPKTIKR